jgi:hypothetical protein
MESAFGTTAYGFFDTYRAAVIAEQGLSKTAETNIFLAWGGCGP